MSIDLRSVTGKVIDPALKPPGVKKEMRQQGGGDLPVSDSVEITDVASRLKQAAEAMATGAVIDTALVSRVADALQAGAYEINAERIAEKIIELEGQLPGLEAVNGSE